MRLSLAVACVATGLALSLFVRADEKPAASAEAKPTELFDGKSLKNWKVPEFGGDGKVTVKDGLLVMGQGDPMTGVTWAGEELPKVDYEVTFEAQRIEGSDFFGTITFPVQKDSCSFVLGGWGGGVIGLSTLDGNSAVENETTGYYDFEKGKWYKIRVRVTKTKIEVWIDDKSVVDVDYSDKRIGIRVEVDLSKPLGFTTYRTTGALRAIKLTKLAAEEKSDK
jgi:hypothetical protein